MVLKSQVAVANLRSLMQSGMLLVISIKRKCPEIFSVLSFFHSKNKLDKSTLANKRRSYAKEETLNLRLMVRGLVWIRLKNSKSFPPSKRSRSFKGNLSKVKM
jgi:hypothetical protein